MSKRRRSSSVASQGTAEADIDDGGELCNPGPALARKKENMDSDGKPQFTNLINTTIGSQDVEMILGNSFDDSSLTSPLSIDGNSNPYNPSMTATPSQERPTSQPSVTPSSSKKKKKKLKIVTGYILFSSGVRKATVANNPGVAFGEISRIVGKEWRSLSASTKQSWDERAAKRNEETSAKLAEEMKEASQNTPMDVTYECAWDTCDFQFEDLSDCTEHCIADGGNSVSAAGHVQQHYRDSGSEYPCLWRNCERVRNGKAPFPTLSRLLRHVRDVHVNKGNGRIVVVHERSRNFMPSTKKHPKTYLAPVRTGMSPGGTISTSSNTSSQGETYNFIKKENGNNSIGVEEGTYNFIKKDNGNNNIGVEEGIYNFIKKENGNNSIGVEEGTYNFIKKENGNNNIGVEEGIYNFIKIENGNNNIGVEEGADANISPVIKTEKDEDALISPVIKTEKDEDDLDNKNNICVVDKNSGRALKIMQHFIDIKQEPTENVFL